jgi:uncharacterized membrane protein YfcA
MDTITITLTLFLIAVLYSSVGHAGASGYIAVLLLFGLPPEIIKPVALSMNIGVALIGSWQFYKAGHFRWALFWPFAILALPMAFIGGYLRLPPGLFHLLIGIVLLASALRFIVAPREEPNLCPPTKPVAFGTGAGLGLLAGFTGTGGGIFLTPILLIMRWASAKEAAAVSVVFILLNSSAGLSGHLLATRDFPLYSGAWIAAVLLGGFCGSHLGSHHLPATWIKRLLASVLFIASGKLLFG